ncbi:hypothetical protein BDV97DRAFT_43159 [Delphinella strobiligena]|nr:hypothetical protein BDV97DRAFT_43159 [Delphinella strobiligena]
MRESTRQGAYKLLCREVEYYKSALTSKLFDEREGISTLLFKQAKCSMSEMINFLPPQSQRLFPELQRAMRVSLLLLHIDVFVVLVQYSCVCSSHCHAIPEKFPPSIVWRLADTSFVISRRLSDAPVSFWVRVPAVLPGLLEPGMLIRSVVDDKV